MKYQKINSVFERDDRGRYTGDYACPEFGYLADVPWQWSEKVNGTNIRLYFPSTVDVLDERDSRTAFRGQEHAFVRGRTDDAQLPPKLLDACVRLLQGMPLEDVFTDPQDTVTLYGEGYGAGIQKGGRNYRPDQSFVLFDVRVGRWWLRRHDVEDVATKLGIDVVPLVPETKTLAEAVAAVKEQSAGGAVWVRSRWENALPEGVVGRPLVDLWDRRGDRIITKLKFRDFRTLLP